MVHWCVIGCINSKAARQVRVQCENVLPFWSHDFPTRVLTQSGKEPGPTERELAWDTRDAPAPKREPEIGSHHEETVVL